MLKKLQERLIALEAEVRAMLELPKKEERDMTVEERESFDGKMTEMETVRADIERAKKMDEMSGWMATPADPAPPKMEITERPEKPFRSLGEQLMAIIRSSAPGVRGDKRLLELRAPTGLGETFPGAGGFLVQTDFSTALMSNTRETGLLAPRCRKVTISENSNGINLPMINETSRATTRAGGVLAYWTDEAALKVASQPEFRMIELKLNKLIGLVWLTDELMADTTALESYVSTEYVKEINFQIDDAIVRGTGAGQPLGFLPSPALVTVAAEIGQAIDTIVVQNVLKMRAAMPYSSRANAVWLINQEIEPQLQAMSLAVGTGGVPVYMPANGVAGKPYDTLFGSPVLPIEQASAIGNVGDISYVDLSEYIIAEKGGIESASSIHVHFVYDETVLRFVLRLDGQPIPAAPQTPYLGAAASLSPFVTLAAR